MSSLQSPGLDSPAWLERRQALSQRLAVARGEQPADLVLAGGRVPNLFTGVVEEVDVAIHHGLVVGLGAYHGRERLDLAVAYLCPGFIEGHLHVESILLAPAQLARAVSPRGTTAAVADSHEIASAMGLEGIQAMLEGSEDLPVTFYFNAPSCVPATPLEDAGARLEAAELLQAAGHPRALGLTEVMNFPGLLADLLRLAVAADLGPLSALRLVAFNAARRFGLAGRGAVALGYAADLVVLEELQGFRVSQVFKSGRLVAQDGHCLHPCVTPFLEGVRGRLRCGSLSLDTFLVLAGGPRARPDPHLAPHRGHPRPGWLAHGRRLAGPGQASGHRAPPDQRSRGLGPCQGLGAEGRRLGQLGGPRQPQPGGGRYERRVHAYGGSPGGLAGRRALRGPGHPGAGRAAPATGLPDERPATGAGAAPVEDLLQGADLICAHPEPFMPLSFISLPVSPHLKLTDRGLMDVDAFAPVGLLLA